MNENSRIRAEQQGLGPPPLGTQPIGVQAGGYPDYGGYAPETDSHDVPGFRQIIGAIWLRRFMIAGIVLLGTVLATLTVFQIEPRYKASAQVVIAPDRQNVVDIDAVAERMKSDILTVRTQEQIILSREIAAQAVDRLKLAEDPKFNAMIRQKRPNIWNELAASLPEPVRDIVDIDTPADIEEKNAEARALAAAPADSPDHRIMREYLIGKFLSGLVADSSSKHRVIDVDYVSKRRRFAALAANTAIELYIEGQKQEKGRATGEAATWLESRAAEMRDRVIESERRLEEFRRASGIVDVDGSMLATRQLADLSDQLLKANGELGAVTARYERVRRLLNGKNRNLSSAGAVLQSPLIDDLRRQEFVLDRKVAELRSQYRDKHPKLRLALAELADQRSRIALEIRKIATDLRNEVAVAKSRVTKLKSEIGQIQGTVDGLKGSEVTLRSLESEVKANRELYQTLLQRLKETNVQDDSLQRADARIISYATVPSKAFYPRKQLMIGLGFVGSFILGIGLAIMLFLINRGFRSLHQVEGHTGLPGLGLVPLLKIRKSEAGILHQCAQVRANAEKTGRAIPNAFAYAEAIRTLRTNVMLFNGGDMPRVLAVSSSVPNEGKSSTVLALAAQVAEARQRCIVVDCDLRNPAVGHAMGHPDAVGLIQYLTDNRAVSECIHVDSATGLHYVPAGATTSQTTELLGAPKMVELIRKLSESYDLVLIDTPPLLVVSDALIVQRVADGLLFLVRWESTSRDRVSSAIRLAADAGAKLVGVALTQVDVKRHAQYGYADSGLYYDKSYRKYYAAGSHA